VLANDFDPGALTHESDQRVAREEALRMMDQVDLKSMHRMRRRKQLEIAEMSTQDYRSASRVARIDFGPVSETLVRDAVLKTPVKEPAQPYKLGPATAKVDVRSA
jgi:hypothetical protein